jgi:hypothetical protein
VPKEGKTNTPEETRANVAMPDLITSDQKATIPKAINDCPSIITGFARAMTGNINRTAMVNRVFMPNQIAASGGLAFS